LSEKKKNIFWQQYVGTERSVLFEADVEQGILSGYSDNYIRVGVEYDPMLVNEIRNTEIIGLGTQGLMSGRVMRMAEAEHE
jgi:threonylcarbamoyladenosine tRNA methylthiotransferase MtaB